MASLSIDRFWHGAPLPASSVTSLNLTLCGGSLVIAFDAPLHGDPAPNALPGSIDRLWEHEVVEVFLAGPDRGYLELEFGPHGHYLALSLSDVRKPQRVGMPLQYAVTHPSPGRFRGRAVIPAEYLPPPPLRANAYAIHAQRCGHPAGPGRCYHAHRAVPGAAPDFHQPQTFLPLQL